MGERSQVFRLRERNRYSRLCFSIGFTSESSSACNHDPDVFPSKPVRPQFVNELHLKTGEGLAEFRLAFRSARG